MNFIRIYLYDVQSKRSRNGGMVVLHSNGRICGNADLINFKVGSSRANTQSLAPLMLPSLEARAEGFFFFWKLPDSAVAFDLMSSTVAKSVPS
jgi:hypothetical protein